MLIQAENLKVAFKTSSRPIQAVRGVTFHINESEVLGIVGESGSGKSVTALSLLNLLPAHADKSGSVLFRNEPVFQYSGEKLRNYRGSKVSMIFQEPGRSFDPIYTIGKTLRETLLAHQKNLSEKEIQKKIIQILEEVNISSPEERIKNFPHQFSGGMLQRIMIAQAILNQPGLLIADEPTTALDVTIQSQIIALLLRMKEQHRLSILFISHNLSLVGNISDRVIVMYAGLIVEEGPKEIVLKTPYHPYTRGLLDSHPSIRSHYTSQRLRTIPGNICDPVSPEPGCPFAPRCWLAKPECSIKIPDFNGSGAHRYRCILPGQKD